jgi:hypothetical protein
MISVFYIDTLKKNSNARVGAQYESNQILCPNLIIPWSCRDDHIMVAEAGTSKMILQFSGTIIAPCTSTALITYTSM